MTSANPLIRRIADRLRHAAAPDGVTIHALGQVALVSWRPNDGNRNFGDELSRAVVCKILADLGIEPPAARRTSRRLLAVGSLLHHARAGDTVWGSGAISAGWRRPRGKTKLDIRAVRGPLTAREVERQGLPYPCIHGDPALLLPELFPGRFGANRHGETVIVPHFFDLAVLPPDPRTVSPFDPWERCVERIAGAEFVVSGSLHGLIVADAFGVPARWLRLSDRADRFKFDDYAQATGRPALAEARSLAEALDLGPDLPPAIDTGALRKAFPADLWRERT